MTNDYCGPYEINDLCGPNFTKDGEVRYGPSWLTEELMKTWPKWDETALDLIRKGRLVCPPWWCRHPPLSLTLLYPYYIDYKLVKAWTWKKSLKGNMLPVRKYIFVRR